MMQHVLPVLTMLVTIAATAAIAFWDHIPFF
jgi:hypothetical protein